MVQIKILLENSSIDDKYKSKHGLSILIECHERKILLDVGSDKKFAENADTMGIDLSQITELYLSHNHNNHTGGLNEFVKINNTASIFIMDDIRHKYYVKFLFFFISVGLKLEKKYRSRITQIKNDQIVNKKIYFLKNTITENIKPTFNNKLFKKENTGMVNDTFDHEGILVIEDDNELLVFNSCSHNGILNVIETVKAKIPGKKIRGYIGGLHLCNPQTKQHENCEYLDNIINNVKKMNINIYTGHCTGKFALDYFKEKMGNVFHEINTGMEIEI